MSIRRNKGMLVCDGGCGALPTATADFNLLRKLKSKAGWCTVQEAGKWRDYCGESSATEVRNAKADVAIKPGKRNWLTMGVLTIRTQRYRDGLPRRADRHGEYRATDHDAGCRPLGGPVGPTG